MEDNRKQWIAPQLIVLGRGTPEENVLAGCKTTKLGGAATKVANCGKSNAARGGGCISTKCAKSTTS